MRVFRFNTPTLTTRLFIGILGIFHLLTLGVACAGTQDHPHLKIGQLFDVKTGQVIPFESLKPRLLNADVIYIGEEHYTPSHIEAALTIMNVLLAGNRQPALAMEMFSWDGQAALDRYRRGEISTKEQFLQESAWEKNWGGDFKDYEPLITFANNHQLNVYALNPPRPLVRLVASKGLTEALQDPSMDEWNVDKNMSLDDPEYRRILFDQIKECHGGMPDKAYQRFYEASIFRDEGMAKVIKEYLKTKGENSSMVSYTGGGHIQYGVPIPNRVRKGQESTVKDLSIYLIALDPAREEEAWETIQEGIADYVWLTAMGPGGPKPRCGEKQEKGK